MKVKDNLLKVERFDNAWLDYQKGVVYVYQNGELFPLLRVKRLSTRTLFITKEEDNARQ